MSGICGILDFGGWQPDRQVLVAMAEAARHRGPDGIGYWLQGGAGLAHLALKTTPESLRETQPLACGDLLVIADARIDNRDDLLATLQAKGHLLSDVPTDVEVILAAYKAWGTRAPEHLLGDFAFAVWNRRTSQLFAARDPMAMRALYYSSEPRRFIFATEVKQILAAPDVTASIHEPAVAAHLIANDDDLAMSCYAGINQLPPAHSLLVDATGCRTWRYWDIDVDLRIEYSNEQNYVAHFLELFKEAVRCRLRSSKPVGISLSGGLDSGSIASMAGSLRQQDSALPELYAYSYAFEELEACDERHISDTVAHHYCISPRPVAAEEAYPLMGYPAHGPDRDEPWIGHYQALIEAVLAKARNDGVGTMLYGMRGDLTMGVDIFDYPDLFRTGRWRALWRDLNMHWQATGVGRKRLAKTYVGDPMLRMLLLRFEYIEFVQRWLGKRAPPSWIAPDFVKRSGLHKLLRRETSRPFGWEYARNRRYGSVQSTLNMQAAKWMERNHARFGLSVADPWSDLRIINFSLAVPQRTLNWAGRRKLLTRRAMKGIMPEEARLASRKIYPSPLYERALKEWAKPTVLNLITNSRSAAVGYIDEPILRAHFASYLGGGSRDARFWPALSLEMWLRQHWP